jgi:hypothetical protein
MADVLVAVSMLKMLLTTYPPQVDVEGGKDPNFIDGWRGRVVTEWKCECKVQDWYLAALRRKRQKRRSGVRSGKDPDPVGTRKVLSR